MRNLYELSEITEQELRNCASFSYVDIGALRNINKRLFMAHKLPYVLVFNSINYKLYRSSDSYGEVWSNSVYSQKLNQPQFAEFATIEEMHEMEQEIKDMAAKDVADLNADRPTGTYYNYIALDFNNECILMHWVPDNIPMGLNKGHRAWSMQKLWGRDLIIPFARLKDDRSLKELYPLMVKDFFFRKDGEVPDGYKWDYGEYEGWLQYRWGDKKNAVDYVAPKTAKTYKPKEVPELIDEDELIAEQYEDEAVKEDIKSFRERQSW